MVDGSVAPGRPQHEQERKNGGPVHFDGASRPGVLLVDPNDGLRADVREAIVRDGRLEVVAEAADAARAVALALRHRPALCLIETAAPGDGVAAAGEIHARLPNCRVVVLTGADRDADVFGALSAGASGYLLKGMNIDRLPQTLWDAHHERAAMPRALVSRLIAQFHGTGPTWKSIASLPGVRLSTREWQVLDLVRQQQSTQEIADRLSLSPATVRSHRARIRRKLARSPS
jgi:DNA-binding NarL/FixJ family response regulator